MGFFETAPLKQPPQLSFSAGGAREIQSIEASVIVPIPVEVPGFKQTVCMYCCQRKNKKQKKLSLKGLYGLCVIIKSMS